MTVRVKWGEIEHFDPLGFRKRLVKNGGMSEHRVSLSWERKTPDFTYDGYDRTHEVGFPGGQKLRGSSAPEFLGRAEHANPEELLAAALASCHMLTFLAIAARSRWTVDAYADDAVAYLEKNEQGKLAITRVTLRPQVRFGGASAPTPEQIRSAHQKAHANCFIANSVRCAVNVEVPA